MFAPSEVAGAVSDQGVDLTWIGSQLARDGVVPVATFGCSIGNGQMSRTARFALHWPPGSGIDGPNSVIAKLPSAQINTRRLCFERGTYLREIDFFERVLPLVSVAAPACFGSLYEPEEERFALLLEDLAAFEPGDQFTNPSLEQLEHAIDQAVALHTPGCRALLDPALNEVRRRAHARAARYADVLAGALPIVRERLGDGIDAEVGDLLTEFVRLRDSWAAATFREETIIHGDFRAENFMFNPGAGAPSLVVLDWQALGVGLGAVDVAFLLGGGLDPERRREFEPGLLDRYHTKMDAAGEVVAPLDRQRDYAVGSLYGLAMAMNSTVRSDVTERGDALFTLMLNRHGRHALDLAALDALENP